MKDKGNHSWDIFISYHRCPSCGFIVECRRDFEWVDGVWMKSLNCPRCNKVFVEKGKRKKSFGPLFGKKEPAEIDWS